MTYTVRQHVNEYKEAPLETCVQRFIQLLDTREVSDNDREFSPTYISSCRVLHQMELGDIISRMRELTTVNLEV